MGYERNYSKITDRKARDAAAVRDMEDYLGEDRMGLLINAAKGCQTAQDVQQINIAVSFAGVAGLPFHAFCRTYCLEAYRLWMADTVGSAPVQTDADGFRLTDETA